MHERIRGARVGGVLGALALTVTLAACGSSGSSGDATSLLKQTFGQQHTVTSGNLSLSLNVASSGSNASNHPIALSFGGPFQSRGTGKLPASNFNISISALGRSGSLGILSTGTSGYLTFGGTSYQLPAATFQRLESSFASITASPGASSNTNSLSKLGINPLHWLVDPSVVGNDTIGGASTKHIKADVNVPALLGDLNTFLAKASSAGVTGASKLPSQLSAATRTKVAAAIKNPSVDVWTGADDKMVRKLVINLTVPVSGQVSSVLGGMTSARIGLTIQYADLNQPQTISAPSNVRPFSEFSTQLRSFLAAAGTGLSGSSSAGAAGSGLSGGSSSAGASGTGSSSSTSPGPEHELHPVRSGSRPGRHQDAEVRRTAERVEVAATRRPRSPTPLRRRAPARRPRLRPHRRC